VSHSGQGTAEFLQIVSKHVGCASSEFVSECIIKYRCMGYWNVIFQHSALHVSVIGNSHAELLE